MVSLGTGPFVTLLTAVLGFPHLCYTFRISFSLNSVAQTMQPNVLGLKVRYGFHLTHLLLQYAHVFFAWAAGEDELCSNVNSFKVILSLFSAYICVNMLWLHIISKQEPKSLFIISSFLDVSFLRFFSQNCLKISYYYFWKEMKKQVGQTKFRLTNFCHSEYPWYQTIKLSQDSDCAGIRILGINHRIILKNWEKFR